MLLNDTHFPLCYFIPLTSQTLSLIGVQQREHVVAGGLPADVGPHVAGRVLHRQQVRSARCVGENPFLRVVFVVS